jgi:hypothetical protein
VTDITLELLDRDLLALVASLEDAAEAEALEALFDLAGRLEPSPEAEQAYRPFVYPH